MVEINLTGLHAQQFDDQMDADRAFAEAQEDCVFFRPSMDGEWDMFVSINEEPPTLFLFDKNTGAEIVADYNWTCVIDIYKAINGGFESSGCRTRLRCPNPCTAELRKELRQMAIIYVHNIVEALKINHKPKGFGK